MKNLNSFSSFVVGMVFASLFSLFTLCFGGVSEVRADVGETFDVNGFFVSYSVDNNFGNYGSNVLQLGVDSRVHRIFNVGIYFSTDYNDPSEVYGSLGVFGTLNASLNENVVSSSTGIQFGDVVIESSINQGYEYVPQFPGFSHNFANIRLFVEPFDIETTSFSYYEYPPRVPNGIVDFNFKLIFRGSFGSGPEGDRRGLPFVPTPGAACVAGLAGIMMLRRRR